MKNAAKLLIFILGLISAASVVRADEPPRRPPPMPPGDEAPRTMPAPGSNNDVLLQRAYRTKNRHILQFIRDQERRTGREGLLDPDFRAELKGKIELLDSGEGSDSETEARSCPSCDRSRIQFNESEIRRLKALLAQSEQSQHVNPMQSNPMQMQQQPGFGGNFFNTSGSMNQGMTGLFAQILGSMMGGGQQSQGFGHFGNGQNIFRIPQQSYSYGNQWRNNQAPAIAGPAMSSGFNYGQSQAPAIAGSAWNTSPAYSTVTNNHYSLINRNSVTGAPAVLPYR